MEESCHVGGSAAVRVRTSLVANGSIMIMIMLMLEFILLFVQ